MRYIVLIYICAGILCAFTVLDAPLKRSGVSRWTAAYTVCAFALAAFVPPIASPCFSLSLPFALAMAGTAVVMVKRRGESMWLRLLGTLIFSVVLYFVSVLLLGVMSGALISALTIAAAALYCAGIAYAPDDAFFFAMLCIWGGQLAAGIYEVAVNGYLNIDMASEAQTVCACAAAMAAFIIKDITIYIRRCLTKRPV